MVTAPTPSVRSRGAATAASAAAAVGGRGGGRGHLLLLAGWFGGWGFTKYPVPVLILQMMHVYIT